jgi:hypothetical protein
MRSRGLHRSAAGRSARPPGTYLAGVGVGRLLARIPHGRSMGASKGGALMRLDRARATRLALLGLLAVGWLLGLAIQWAIAVRTGYLDIFPPQMLLGVVLCLGAGAAERVLDPVRRNAKWGALAGIAMIVTIVVGYLVLVALLSEPSGAGEGGETWYTLLLEAPFWIGVPLVTGAACGALGWRVADRRTGSGRPAARPR